MAALRQWVCQNQQAALRVSSAPHETPLRPVKWQALTDERRLRAFTQSEATSQPQPGGAFSMYGGSVQVQPMVLGFYHCDTRWPLR